MRNKLVHLSHSFCLEYIFFLLTGCTKGNGMTPNVFFTWRHKSQLFRDSFMTLLVAIRIINPYFYYFRHKNNVGIKLDVDCRLLLEISKMKRILYRNSTSGFSFTIIFSSETSKTHLCKIKTSLFYDFPFAWPQPLISFITKFSTHFVLWLHHHIKANALFSR